MKRRLCEKGFSLVELLVVLGLVATLAALALRRYAADRARGYKAQVRADLRSAAVAQEAYFADRQAYVSGVLSIDVSPGFRPSAGVMVTATC